MSEVQPQEEASSPVHDGTTPTKAFDDIEAEDDDDEIFTIHQKVQGTRTMCMYSSSSHTFEGVRTHQAIADTITSMVKAACSKKSWMMTSSTTTM